MFVAQLHQPSFDYADCSCRFCRFWSCPNGKECKYKHALPPGYILKSQMKVQILLLQPNLN